MDGDREEQRVLWEGLKVAREHGALAAGRIGLRLEDVSDHVGEAGGGEAPSRRGRDACGDEMSHQSADQVRDERHAPAHNGTGVGRAPLFPAAEDFDPNLAVIVLDHIGEVGGGGVPVRGVVDGADGVWDR